MACSHAVRCQDLLCIANTPCQVPNVAVSLDDFRCKLDAEHLMNCKDDPLSEFAVSLDKATEGLFRGVRSNFWIPVEAVLDDWEKSLLDRAMNGSVGVDLNIIFVESWILSYLLCIFYVFMKSYCSTIY